MESANSKRCCVVFYSVTTKIIGFAQIIVYAVLVVLDGWDLWNIVSAKDFQLTKSDPGTIILAIGLDVLILLLFLIPGFIMGFILLIGSIKRWTVYLNAWLVQTFLGIILLIGFLVYFPILPGFLALAILILLMPFVVLDRREIKRSMRVSAQNDIFALGNIGR